MVAAVSELFGARELLRNFLVRDLNVRYKGSALGVVWSLLNPLLMMAVYTIVFSKIIGARTPHGHYPIWFLAGFLPWTFFSTSLQMGSMALLSHASLIQKVYFPREVLALSVTVANLVNLGIALAIFLPVTIALYSVSWAGLLVLIPVTAALFLFAAGLAMVLSALVVYFRDVEFLLGIGLQAWFFLTPVVYSLADAPAGVRNWLHFNPAVPFVNAYRDAIYEQRVPPAGRVGECLAIGVVVFLVSYAAFDRLKRRVAEEL